ncbi:cytochrome-c oxidase, cbb3-type subunit III [Iodobacter arcticus]|uniref:Cbb3-type cytochrome c oxidase subunit n=1 Tax=Iodobacter arcticus TaxID=590593 RepID=A0ABW2R0J1_9NEIS
MTDFQSIFWNYWIAIIVIGGIVAMTLLLMSQGVVKLKKGENADVTGHKWDDDLEEYNNPLPGWWVMMFYMTIVFSVVYLVLYPGIWGGVWKWTSTNQYGKEVVQADSKYQHLYDKYSKMPIASISNSQEAMDMGKRLYLTYCIQCHGADARGAKGFPNLTDGEWLHGGSPEKILETIAKGRHGQMPAFGAVFGEEKVKDAANYVLQLAGKPRNELRASRGAETFKQVCVACHGVEGKGNQDLGAPNLTDNNWLYGGSEAVIIETITNGRSNVMPAWKEFLGDAKVHLLAGYVYGLSNKEKAK